MMSASTGSCAIASTSAGRPDNSASSPQKVSRAVNDERPVIAEVVALGDGDPAREDDHEARSDLADGPKQFTGSKRAQVAEPTHPLDFERIKRGINLVVPLFANGLPLQRHGPPRRPHA